MQHVRANKVRGLGVTSPANSPVVPELTAIAGAGVKGYSVELWWGLLAPPGLPAPLVAMMNAEVNKALGSQDLKDVLAREGTEPWSQSAADFAGVIKSDIERWKKVAKEANIKAE